MNLRKFFLPALFVCLLVGCSSGDDSSSADGENNNSNSSQSGSDNSDNNDPSDASDPGEENCVDSAGGATDSYGDGCSHYDQYPEECGGYDDDDFFANEMCCACGGGGGGTDVSDVSDASDVADPSDIPDGMVHIPAGKFMMGCNSAVDSRCFYDESPYHEVYLDSFYIDTYEVTAGAYKACVDAGVCVYDGECYNKRTYNNGRDNHPINCVNWDESKTYCEWLGKRLPTEAEWEKAARGTDGRKYPWGNSPEVSCTHAVQAEGNSDCNTNQTWEVGSKPLGVSPYGAHDMIGNVSEWTADWYIPDYYSQTPAEGWVNPEGPAEGYNGGNWRVARGGGFHNSGVSTSSRSRDTADVRVLYYVGFRCAQ